MNGSEFIQAFDIMEQEIEEFEMKKHELSKKRVKNISCTIYHKMEHLLNRAENNERGDKIIKESIKNYQEIKKLLNN